MVNYGLIVGDKVTISGVIASIYNMTGGYNGTFTIATAPTTTTFTATGGAGLTPGTWTSGGTTNSNLGKIVLQMNEKTSLEPSASSYSITRVDAGSGFTSVGTLALLNLADEVVWTTPYFIYGHKRFTFGVTAPYTATLPTVTATNPTNHQWFYDIDVGSGFSGTYKNLILNKTGWGITAANTILTLTPVTATVTGSIASNVLTVTALSSGSLRIGMIVTGAGIAANTIITDIIDAIQGGVGTYTLSTITFAAGNYSISSTNQTVASTTVTGSMSTYLIKIGDVIFDTTTPANMTIGTKVLTIDSATQVTTDTNTVTTAAAQALSFSAIHNEVGIVAATGVKLRIKVVIDVYATSNLLTTFALPTVTDSVFQQIQYPLDLATLALTGLRNPSEVRIYPAGSTTEIFNTGQETIISGTFSTQLDSGTYTSIDISILCLGFQNLRLLAIPFTSAGSTIPVVQQLDRQYLNP